MKVSVIIPVYNAEKYLDECLKSVLSQTLRDIEVICVDDGSPDGSLRILRAYEQKDGRITIIEQKNSGTAIAKNNALKSARGEYVAFMDPDDYYPDNRILELLYSKAKENNVKICGGSFSSLIQNKIIANYGYQQKFLVFDQEMRISYSDYQFDSGYTRFVYDRKMLADYSIWFPNYSRFEDPPFFVQAMICAKEFYAVPDIVYRYRQGKKRKRYTDKMINDSLHGIIDNLTMSAQMNLTQLHQLTLKHLNRNYLPFIIKNISDKNGEMMRLLIEANHQVDCSLLDENNEFIQNHGVLTPLLFINRAAAYGIKIDRCTNFIGKILGKAKRLISGH